jgi:hypothetical protein
MTVDNRKCFATAEALKRFEPETLCEFLGKYPEYVAARLGGLPDAPTEKVLPYDKIAGMFIQTGDDTPGDFLEKMVLIIEMAQPGGQDKLMDEARRQGVPVESFRGKTLFDTAMRAALLPGDLLDRAHARVVLFRKRRFAYYPPALEVVPLYRAPSDEALGELGDSLTYWFHNAKTKIKAKVLLFDFPDEAWFVVRRGGQPIRMAVYDDDGEAVSRFMVPETYDGIVYNKVHGELRIISKLKPEFQAGYRARFGALIMDDAQFFEHRTMFFPERVATLQPEDLAWAGNSTIGSIRLAEVRYQLPGGETVCRRSPKTLLAENVGGHLIPPRAEKVLYAEFKFMFLSDKRERSVRVDAGCEATYLRDSDAALLEQFLRDKGLMRAAKEQKAKDEKAA